MRVMIIVKANRNSEAGRMPGPDVLAQMQAFNEEAAAAGVLVGMGGLQPSANGKRAKASGGKRMILDGPFTETKELIAGYAIWEVASMDEAMAWVARFPDTGEDEEIEIRPMYDEGPCGHRAEIARVAKPIAAE
jgi:hypothetical protein